MILLHLPIFGIPPPGPPGDDCGICFAPGDTPGTMYVSLSGIEQGDNWDDRFAGPPNSTFAMPQAAQVCTFEGNDGTWFAEYRMAAGFASMRVLHIAPAGIAFVDFQAPCNTGFINDKVVAFGNIYFGGSATVWTP